MAEISRQRLVGMAIEKWDQPFQWGVGDCAQFTGYVVREVTGIDFLSSFAYADEKGAWDILSKEDGLRRLVTKILGEPVDLDKLEDGDPVLIVFEDPQKRWWQALAVLFCGTPVTYVGRAPLPVHGATIECGWHVCLKPSQQ